MTVRSWSRRELIRIGVVVGAGGALPALTGRRVAAVDFTAPVPEAKDLTAYNNHGQIILRYNDQVAAAYRANPAQKYPYFYPLAGPLSGASLTTESALPYPHHRGLWLGCDPLAGGNYWSDGPLSEGQIRSTGIEIVGDRQTPKSVIFTDRCEWIRANAPTPCSDVRRFSFAVWDERVRILDVSVRLTAAIDLEIQRAKHSFFAMRCAPDISPMYGGVLMNSEGGVGAEGTYGKPASWCGYHGSRATHGKVVEGIAIMDHPKNPWAPCPWFTREYGHLSPSPFNFLKKPWTLAAGESIDLRYRVVLHAGDPKEADLDGLYDQWVRE